MKVLMCVPNISEGRDLAIVEQVLQEIRRFDGVKIIDQSSDAHHNRSVLTYLGRPEPLLEATKAMALKAIELIDMSCHQGSHPRMGAVDVVPFVPVRGIDTQEAVEIAREYGRFIGQKGIPVLLRRRGDPPRAGQPCGHQEGRVRGTRRQAPGSRLEAR